MNNDLISRSALKEWLTRPTGFRANCEDCTEIDCLDCIIGEAIDNAPAVDAETVIKSLPYVKEALEMAKQSLAPVRHGEWRIFRDGCVLLAECSECGTVQSGIAAAQWDYCPMCGCRMDGGADNDQA